MKKQTFIWMGSAVLSLAGCASSQGGGAAAGGADRTAVGMANPASVYCQSLGGRSEPVQGANGVYSICHLPDGTQIEEWELYRRDHPQTPR
ncbi:DUF333 domain-containing protein [Corticibacter populi]|uniref:DUF333 domain-containing protein n=1 Tax=Corticibacter populi TaxID=1550736 RepID=A0A3M6QZK2_9BURK|nr:DUF333 domain-containing protein [Corticibacter populi]RMX08049.1 DUF333 domain-containing protein [Corticibacter populi]RZS35294.1 hypothetical protein EV687_0355 [Corticibacter populi]